MFIIRLIILILYIGLSTANCLSVEAVTHVRGYYKSNGTYVSPHVRSSPDSSVWNNWSTKGNINPYTGKKGTKNPEKGYSGYLPPSYSGASFPDPNSPNSSPNSGTAIFSFGDRGGFTPKLPQNVSPQSLDKMLNEALSDAFPRISLINIPPRDPNFLENLSVRKGGDTSEIKRAMYDYGSSYGIISDDGTLGYYYDNDGGLSGVDEYVGATFPKKVYQYDYPFGNLRGVGLWITPDIGYVFDSKGHYMGSWDKKYQYDTAGNKVSSRKIYGVSLLIQGGKP